MAQRSVVQVAPLSFRASLSPGTIDEEKRTVELIWTTGARVLRGFFNQFWEELSLDPKHVRLERLNGGAPLLNSHNGYDLAGVIGVVESARIEKARGVAVVRFAKAEDDPEADRIFRKVKDGIIRNVSVGYRVHKMEQIEEEGKIPVFRAVDWTPYEISIVPVGADAGAGVRSEQETNPCVFIQERAMPDPVPESPTPTNPAPSPAPAPAPTPTPAPASQPQLTAEQRAQVEREAQERILGIQRVGRALGRPEDEINKAITDGTSLADFRAAAQDAYADEIERQRGGVDGKQPIGTIIAAGEDSRDKWLRGAGAWIIQRAGVAGVVSEAAAKRGEKIDLDPGEFRGKRLLDFAIQSLERNGVRTAGMLPREIIGKAFTYRSSFNTTGDFPVLLENTLNKVLLAAYAVTPDTWTRFCARGSVSDFKASKRYRVGTFGALDDVNEHGEFKTKNIPDGERQSLQAGTKGNIVGITRQAIINDDLGVFSATATQLGRAGKLSVEVAVYKLLALNGGLGPEMSDGKTLFHANHGNLTTGAPRDAANLDLDRVAMGLQKDPSGNELLDLSPAVLLVSKALGGQARVINDSQFDPDTVVNKAQMKANIAGKMFRDIVDTGRITGTRRYLFADPAIAPTIEVAFLDGQEEPYMEMRDGWNVDGVEWKVRLDFGVAAVDWRGAVTNAGAA